jgi:HEAT repeat protein
MFAGITDEIQKAFPGKYPAMFNMSGASLSLPEAMGFMGTGPSSILADALSRMQAGSAKADDLPEPIKGVVHQAMEDMAWKFGVMFADAKDARGEQVTRLIELLESESNIHRAAAALTLPWYGDKRALEPVQRLLQDSDETVRISATWAVNALQKTISYRDRFGM